MELLGGVRALPHCAPMKEVSYVSLFGSGNRWICSGIKAKRVFRKVTIFSIFIFLGSVNQWICSGSKAKRVFRKVIIYTKCAHFLAQGIDGFVLVLRPKRVFRKVRIFSIPIFLGSVNRWICSGIQAKIVCRKVFSYNFIHFHTFHTFLVYFCTFSYIFVHFRTFSYSFVHFRTFSYIFVHFRIF